MILSDQAIKEKMRQGKIIIDPFDEHYLGPNSYDVHLSHNLFVVPIRYDINTLGLRAVDPRHDEEYLPQDYVVIPPSGYTLQPKRLYLGVVQEYTETHQLVPFIEGKSSLARLGLGIHITAGRGDSGYCGNFTLEITCVHPIRVTPGMPIGQLIYHAMYGDVEQEYGARSGSKYKTGRQDDPMPIPSRMYKNWDEEKQRWK